MVAYNDCPGREHPKFYTKQRVFLQNQEEMTTTKKDRSILPGFLVAMVFLMILFSYSRGTQQLQSLKIGFLVLPAVQKALGIKMPGTDF